MKMIGTRLQEDSGKFLEYSILASSRDISGKEVCQWGSCLVKEKVDRPRSEAQEREGQDGLDRKLMSEGEQD
jgi:hypothetical protein